MVKPLRVRVSFELTRYEADALLESLSGSRYTSAVARRDAKRKLRVAIARGTQRYDTRDSKEEKT